MEKLNGRYYQLDADGFFVNDSVPIENEFWKHLLAVSVERIRREMSLPVVSIYVRGSISRGLAQPGFSDLDLLVIYRNEAGSQTNWAWSKSLDRALAERYPACAGIDIDFLDESLLFSSRSGRPYLLLLATQAQLVEGADLSERIPKFRPGKEVLFQTQRLPRDIERLQSNPTGGFGADDRNPREVLRRAIRAAGEVASMTTNLFTRDLDCCCEAFCKAFPARSASVRDALKLVFASKVDAEEAIRALKQLLGDLEYALTGLTSPSKPQTP